MQYKVSLVDLFPSFSIRIIAGSTCPRLRTLYAFIILEFAFSTLVFCWVAYTKSPKLARRRRRRRPAFKPLSLKSSIACQSGSYALHLITGIEEKSRGPDSTLNERNLREVLRGKVFTWREIKHCRSCTNQTKPTRNAGFRKCGVLPLLQSWLRARCTQGMKVYFVLLCSAKFSFPSPLMTVEFGIWKWIKRKIN